jgi:hypothetical protein
MTTSNPCPGLFNTPNPYMAAARAKKVQDLVSTIDRLFAYVFGPTPHAERARLLNDGMGNWAPRDWAELAREAKCRTPSPETIAAVHSVYARRAAFAPPVVVYPAINKEQSQ